MLTVIAYLALTTGIALMGLPAWVAALMIVGCGVVLAERYLIP